MRLLVVPGPELQLGFLPPVGEDFRGTFVMGDGLGVGFDFLVGRMRRGRKRDGRLRGAGSGKQG